MHINNVWKFEISTITTKKTKEKTHAVIYDKCAHKIILFSSDFRKNNLLNFIFNVYFVETLKQKYINIGWVSM